MKYLLVLCVLVGCAQSHEPDPCEAMCFQMTEALGCKFGGSEGSPFYTGPVGPVAKWVTLADCPPRCHAFTTQQLQCAADSQTCKAVGDCLFPN